MKKILSLLTALLMICAVSAAAASSGDRTVLHIKSNGGYSGGYAENVLATDDGIYILINASERKILRCASPDAETEEYRLGGYEDFMTTDEQGVTTYENIIGLFSWNGAAYCLISRDINDPSREANEIEGGIVRKVVLQDGKALLEETDDIPQLEWDLMTENYGEWKSSRYLSQMTVCGDRLLGSTWDENGNNILISFDLTTGYAEDLYMQNLGEIYPGPDGSILMTRYEYGENYRMHLLQFDPQTRSEEELANISLEESSINGICFDEKTGNLYFVREGEIWAAPGMNMDAAEAVNNCPMTGNVFMIPLADGRMLLWNNQSVLVRGLDPAERNVSFNLVIQDYIWGSSLSETIYDFSDVNGDVSVVLRRGGNAGTILQSMMNRDAETDIYTLAFSSSEFDALRNRGFLADLSGNAAVSAAAERMYPYLREALSRDGKIVALPVSLNGNAFGIYTEKWEKLGGTAEELPKTWDQFFDWLEKMPERLKGTNAVVFESWMSKYDLRYMLLNTILTQYQAYINDSGRDYAFNTPLLRGLLERIDRVDWEALGIREQDTDQEGGMMVYSEEDTYQEPLLNSYSQLTVETWNSNADILALSFAEGETPILPIEMNVAFVNPYSAHAEAAAEFLAMSLNNLETSISYSLFADQTEPVRDPYYEESKKEMQHWLDEARANLEKADESEKEMWADSVKNWEEYMEQLENSWLISPKAISAYQNRTGMLRPLSYDFVNSLSADNGAQNIWELFDGYGSGTVTAEELLSGIDKKVQMMRLEGN